MKHQMEFNDLVNKLLLNVRSILLSTYSKYWPHEDSSRYNQEMTNQDLIELYLNTYALDMTDYERWIIRMWIWTERKFLINNNEMEKHWRATSYRARIGRRHARTQDLEQARVWWDALAD